jgi:tetratricopeptide (TPR) repeat protein
MAKPGFNADSADAIPLTLIKPDAEDGIRAEFFSQLDRRPMSARELTQKLNQLLSQLETASEIARTSGPGASVEAYTAAVRTAESIDQVSVSRERKNIREQLKDKNLDSATRRELLQTDANLHTLERSRGFTVANYALLLIRNGDQQQGVKLLLDAQARDREMSDDPNFKRHFKDAIKSAETLTARRTADPAFITFDESSGKPAGRVRTAESFSLPRPTEAPPTPLVIPPAQFGRQVAPGATRPAPWDVQPVATPGQTQPLQPGQAQSFAPTQSFAPHGQVGPADVTFPGRLTAQPGPVRPDQPSTPTQPFIPGQRFTPTEQAQIPQPSQPGARPEYVAAHPQDGKDRSAGELKASPLDAQNRTPTQAVAALWGEVCRTNKMTPDVQQAFLKAIENSSNSISPRLIPYKRAQEEAAAALVAAITPEVASKIQALDATALTVMNRLPSEKAVASYQLFSTMDGLASAEEKANVAKQLVQIDPAFGPILTAREQAMGPALLKAVLTTAKAEKDMEAALRTSEGQAEANQAAITRFSYGLALEKVGRKEEAKTFVAEAIKLNASSDVGQNAYWYETAKRLGLQIEAPGRVGASEAPKEIKPVTPSQPGDVADLLGQAGKKYHDAITRGVPAAEAFQQVATDFKKAIGKGDGDFVMVAAKMPAMEKLAQDVDKEMTPELLAKVGPINALIRSEKAKVAPQFADLVRDYQDITQTDEKRAALKAELTKVAPALVAAYDQLEATASKDLLTKFVQVQKDQLLVAEALGKRFLTRQIMAEYADRAGDQALAKQTLTEAFASIPEPLQTRYMQQADVATLAARLGVSAPMPPDTVLSEALKAGEAAKVEAIKPVPGVDAENQGLRHDQILQLAKQKLQAEGMTPAAKKLFEDAIRVADSLFGPTDIKNIEQTLERLQNDKHPNGQPLTVQDRVFAHLKINEEFSLATFGLQCRNEYAALLLQHKQYQTAEKIQRERINVADGLPLELIKKEMDILLKDMQNPKIERGVQLDLANRYDAYAGRGHSKDDGLIYMPVVCRKLTADFYISARENRDYGIWKPDQAFHMINEIKDLETRRYGIDFAKNPGADATLMDRAKMLEKEISPELRKDKARYDTWWSNAVVDGAAAGIALTGAAFLASLATKRPQFFKMALTAEGTALSTGGKLALATGVVGTATVGRHYLHQALTGESEGWDQSLIHGSAGVGGVVAIMGTRATLGNWLLKGASEEGLVLKIAERYGTRIEGAEAAAASQKMTVEQFGKYLADSKIAVSPTVREYIAKNGAQVLVEGGVLQKATFDAVKMGLNPAQSTALAAELARPAVERGMIGKNIDRIVRGYQNVKGISPFGSLDLATSSIGKIRMRAGYANFAEATAGLGTYNTITALDRTDPATGEKISFTDSLIKAHYRNPMDNTLANALFLQLMMKNGNVARTGADGIKARMMAPISASKWGVGATTGSVSELATIQAMAKQGAYLSFASRAFDLSGRIVDGQYAYKSYETQQKLDKIAKPITNETPPTVKAVDTITISPKTGDAAPPPPPVPPSGDLKDEPAEKPKVDLMKDTPGLGP